MSAYDQTSATADNYHATFVDTDSADCWIEVEVYTSETEWVSDTVGYEISQELMGLVSENSFWKKMDRLEKLIRWTQKMITIDKKQFKPHMTLKRKYYLKN